MLSASGEDSNIYDAETRAGRDVPSPRSRPVWVRHFSGNSSHHTPAIELNTKRFYNKTNKVARPNTGDRISIRISNVQLGFITILTDRRRDISLTRISIMCPSPRASPCGSWSRLLTCGTNAVTFSYSLDGKESWKQRRNKGQNIMFYTGIHLKIKMH